MKIPIIRHLYKNNSVAQIESTIEVLESFCEHRSVKEEEVDLAGELITNLCGAIEVHQLVSNGMTEIDAVNAFSKKVLGSIDQ